MLVYQRVHILMVGKYNFDGIYHEHMRFLWRFVSLLKATQKGRKESGLPLPPCISGGALFFVLGSVKVFGKNPVR